MEIMRLSRRWAEKRFPNIVYWNELERGGHFAAWEQPEVFVREVRAAFGQPVGRLDQLRANVTTLGLAPLRRKLEAGHFCEN